MVFIFTAFDITQYAFYFIKLLCICLFNYTIYIYAKLLGTKHDLYTLASFLLVELALLADFLLSSIALFGILI